MATFKASVSLRLATAASLEGLGMACSTAEHHVKQAIQQGCSLDQPRHAFFYVSESAGHHLWQTLQDITEEGPQWISSCLAHLMLPPCSGSSTICNLIC